MIKKGSQLENVYVGELTVLDKREAQESCSLGLRVLLGVGKSGGRTRVGSLQKHHCGYFCPGPSMAVAAPATGTLEVFRNTDFWASSHLCLSKHRSATEHCRAARQRRKVSDSQAWSAVGRSHPGGDPSLAPLAAWLA